jgi:hypothetical protein
MLDVVRQTSVSDGFRSFALVMGMASSTGSQAATLLRLKAGRNSGAHMLRVTAPSGADEVNLKTWAVIDDYAAATVVTRSLAGFMREPSIKLATIKDGLAFLIAANVGPRIQTKSNTDIHSHIVGLGTGWKQVATLSSEPFHYISSEGFVRSEFSICVRDLYLTLQQEPVLDGFNHPGQPILIKIFESYPGAASEWMLDHITKLSYPSRTADIIRLLCRFRPRTSAWRSQIVAAALRSSSVEVRDAAIQAVESWAEPELVSLLRKHSDTAQWLAEYAAQIIRDIAG